MSGVTPLERAGYLAHARTARFQKRLVEARECIQLCFTLAPLAYLSWSGGKDSSALLWLVAEINPQIEVRILTSGETRLLHRNLDDLLAWWRGERPEMTLTEICMDRVFSAEWAGATWAEQRKAGKRDLQEHLPKPGAEACFLGLRAEESHARRMGTRVRYPGTRHAIRRVSGGRIHCCPLADWRTEDVAALHALHGIPLLQAYEAEGMEARTTARLTGDAARAGALHALRLRDPDSFTQLTHRFPELAAVGGYL